MTTRKRRKGRARKATAEPPVSDPAEAAAAAGLSYVSDTRPGIRRRRSGSGFSYVGPDGLPLRDKVQIARIRSLAIPPAYTDVWISPNPQGHIQATGRDARGRKQYRYHPRWRATRDETKYGRMLAFSDALPAIRARVDEDLGRPGLPREKVLATVVRLLESTCIRVGNDEYARDNKSFGLTTLQDRHVTISGSTIKFSFRGKSGKQVSCGTNDRRLARIVQRCQDLPGAELFQYQNEAGEPQDIGSGDVNAYIREISGQDFTAKDFRTWAGTKLAAAELEEIGAGSSEREAKSNIVRAVDLVSEQLNNTRAVCRKYYVHPAVFDSYSAGTLHQLLAAKGNGSAASASGLEPDEQAVVRLIRGHLEQAGGGAS